MLNEKLTHLRRLLAESDAFQDTMTFFMESIVPTEEFRRIGIWRHSEKIAMLLAASARSIFRKEKINIEQIVEVFIEAHALHHGAILVENHLGAYFYFDDLEMGMMMVIVPNDRTWVTRISTLPGNGGLPVFKPDKEIN
ncbi:MAG TPA: hypothetical protein PKD93_13075 [Ferruginibacter sp.]|nr:hypothetical protein [Ferruginibacter sp.]